ncbi:uncharacterized protein EAE97_004416 [Botrytis byssoidea]|uniref:2EXR domain-containing protein n=1 Tax=Botrytis byssoidea TaxID=139641 RepID=A0A9P5IMM0_9HELO|nr:uncharacterized protein EAE97_004416 [Botrytis byssoidea]KAF7947167.1 hypothetical protein EAE97_004416 [Botrytis byssoidea]
MTSVSAPVVSDRNATFYSFPRLPLEIQRMIWRAALPGPRNVALKRFCLKAPEYPIVLMQEPLEGMRPETQIQQFSTLARESLEVASETYTLTFGSLGVGPRTWFNYDIDLVHLDMSFIGMIVKNVCDNIANVIGMPAATIEFLSLDEIDDLDDATEGVFVKPEVDGISPSMRLNIDLMKKYRHSS